MSLRITFDVFVKVICLFVGLHLLLSGASSALHTLLRESAVITAQTRRRGLHPLLCESLAHARQIYFATHYIRCSVCALYRISSSLTSSWSRGRSLAEPNAFAFRFQILIIHVPRLGLMVTPTISLAGSLAA